MSKILITSIGTGTYNATSKSYEYRSTIYSLDEQIVDTPYIFNALTELRDYDKLIFVGTAGSNWSALYWFICEKNAIEPDDEYLDTLLNLEKTSNKATLDVAEIKTSLDGLKQAFCGICADIIVLKYGLNDSEHIANFELLAKIGEQISDGDFLTFDITHSFRSLAMYELLAVTYIKETLGKRVTLDFVSYGMLEIAPDNGGITPIVDLSVLIQTTNWLKAAEEYRRSGTTALLAELIKRNDIGLNITKEEKKVLKRLGGDAIHTSDLQEFKNLVKSSINATKNIDGVIRKNIALDYIFSDIANRFGDKLDDDMLLQAELAKWHLDKKRYISAAITVVEATINYCANLAGMSKDAARKRICGIRSANSDVGNFRKRYDTIRKLRNKLAHAEPPSEAEVETLKEYTKGFYSTYANRFKAIPANEQALRVALTGAAATESDDVDD
jgi:CRISPR-associated Csx2 family protein